jgi:K(+)-stimulated pyrophosphate-energized sodium pump
MSIRNNDNPGVMVGALIGVVVLAASLAVGVRLDRPASENTGNVVSPGAAGAVVLAPVQAVETNAADSASVQVENGAVKFYFATRSAALAADAPEALADVVKGVAAGQTATITSYPGNTGGHGDTGELVRQRALAVRDALKSLGIGDDKLALKSPETLHASSGPEAGWVEVTLE